MSQKVKVYIVNAFAENGKGGSPTGVVLDAAGLSEDQMQYISNNVPASHTAFVTHPVKENKKAILRFFTKQGEILNCGHGTIAAHYARAKILNLSGEYNFIQQVKEGNQQVEIIAGEAKTDIYLYQNEITFSLPSHGTVRELINALSIRPSDVVTDPPAMLASPGSNRILLGLKSADLVNDLRPDFDKLRTICNENESIGCFVYAMDKKNPHPEATARMFAPNIGIDEDIINGNSSGCLGAYLFWLTRQPHLELQVRQGQAFNRDATVSVKVKWINNRIQTVIGGTAHIEKEIWIEGSFEL